MTDDKFLSGLSAPAKRALANEGIKTVQDLARYSESRLLALHGLGPSSIPKLMKALKEHGLRFSKK